MTYASGAAGKAGYFINRLILVLLLYSSVLIQINHVCSFSKSNGKINFVIDFQDDV